MGRCATFHLESELAGLACTVIRFELLREGIEDYEYLWLLTLLGDGAFADEAAKSMVVNVRAFSRNVEQLFARRGKMTRRIEELMAKQGPAPAHP